jgi:hypothetical protein
MTNNYELLIERLAELELSLEDSGWQQLVGNAENEFSREALRKICNLALLFWLKNPLIKRGVSVQAHYVFGQGVSIRAQDEQVNEVIQAFLDDAKNQTELTSHQAMMTKEQELTVYANLFFVFFTNVADGRVRIRIIPFDEIADVITNPEDSKDPWYYKRSWTEQGIDGKTSVRTALYPDWRYRPADKPETVNNITVQWKTPVYHVAVNKLSNMRFGVSEVYAAIDWANSYREFLTDWATITRMLSRFAYKLSTPGGKSGIAAAKTKLSTTYGLADAETNPAPVTGSTFISGTDVKLDPMRIGGANVSAEDGRRLLLMVAAAQGLPETFYGDTSVGTLATAKSLDRPTELQMRNRQTLWADVFDAILAYVIEQSVRAPGGTLKGAVVEDDDGTPVVTLDQVPDESTGKMTERDATVTISFPSILEHDVAASVTAIVQAATLGGGTLAGTIDQENVSRMLLTALGDPDVDATLDAMYPEETETPEGETPTTEVRMVKAAKQLREAMCEFVERRNA